MYQVISSNSRAMLGFMAETLNGTEITLSRGDRIRSFEPSRRWDDNDTTVLQSSNITLRLKEING